MKVSDHADLQSLEKKLKFLKTVQNFELVANYGLSEDDQCALTAMLRATLYSTSKEPDYRTYITLLREFPFCCLVQMTGYVMFSEDDEFWQPWAAQFGFSVDTNHQGRIGQHMLEAIDKTGLYCDEGENEQATTNKYVRVLQSLTGVPNYALDKLFDVLSYYSNQYFDPAALRSELLSWRNYLINRVTARFLKRYPDESVALLLTIYDIMQSHGAASSEGIEARITQKFCAWRENADLHGSEKKRRQEAIPLPTVQFLESGAGLCLQFPSIRSKNEYSDYVLWRVVTSDSGVFEFKEKLYKRADGLETREHAVAVPPCDHYTVSLLDGAQKEKLIDEKRIPGKEGLGYLLFDKNGKRSVEAFLPEDSGYLVIPASTATEFSFITKNRLMLPETAHDHKAFYFSYIDGAAQIRIGVQPIILKPRAGIKAGLVGTAYLFGEKPRHNMMPLFTEKPQLNIELPALPEGESSIQIRHLQSGKQYTMQLQAAQSPFSLDEAVSSYGTYDIRVYAGAKLLKRLPFGFVPFVPYNDQTVLYPDKNGFTKRSGFQFDSSVAEIVLLSRHASLSDHASKRCWKNVWITGGEPSVRGQLSCDCGGIRCIFEWEKTVHAVSWSIWNERADDLAYCSKTYTTALGTCLDKKLWLSVWLDPQVFNTGSEVKLSLISVDGSPLQNDELRLNNYGACSIPLHKFADTLRQTRLPANIVLDLGQNASVTLMRITDTVELPKLTHQISTTHESMCILSWGEAESSLPRQAVIYGMTDTAFIRPLSQARRAISADRVKLLVEDMPAGVYKIGLPPTEDDFFVGSGSWRPQTLGTANTFVVKAKEFWRHVDDLESLIQLLVLAAALPDKQELLPKLKENYCRQPCFVQRKTGVQGISHAISKLSSMLILSFAEADDSFSKAVLEVLDGINRTYFSNTMRAEISRQLLRYDMSPAELKLCFRCLNLFLSSSDEATLSTEEIQKIGNFNEELELLWMLRMRQTDGLLHKVKLIVGLDLLKECLRFHKTADTEGRSWEQLLEGLFEGEEVGIEFVLTGRASGQTEDFYSMIEWGKGYQAPWINFEKRPSDGVYFCGQTYYDILAAWWLSYDKNRAGMDPAIAVLQTFYSALRRIAQEQRQTGPKFVKEYFAAMEARDMGEESGLFPMMYFCAIAALTDALHYHGLIDEETHAPAVNYLMEMMTIFPDLVKHDLLLAEFVIFLNGEELKHANEPN